VVVTGIKDQAKVNITPGDASQEVSGNFDDNATPLWSLYKEKAQIHDEAKVQILTKSMTDVLLFVRSYTRTLVTYLTTFRKAGLFAAALAPFIVDRSQAIQVTPAQQMVFYEQQSVDLLKQISAQIASLSPQASVPSPSPLPPLTANPSRSDKLVNVLLFISLVLSLSAALLATLVQRWARDHMQIFHRYKHPLKVSRIRQYLHERIERWHMAMIAEAVPTLIHVSLFLFLVGFAVFLSNANGTVAIPTIFFIMLFFAWYLIATILPVAKPQFPLRSPVSVLLWFVVQSFSLRLHKNRGDGELKPVSQNMVDGLMELALEDKPVRTYRDRRAIAWLAQNLTRDVEMDSLASIILDSFNLEWVMRVWGKRANDVPTNDNSTTRLTIYNHDILYPLCTCIGHLFQTCSNPYLFENEDKRLTRSRTSIRAIAMLVFRMRADLDWFGDIETIGKLLKAQGYGDHPRPSLATGSNQSFAANWTGLSIVIIQKVLVMERSKVAANEVLLSFRSNSPNEAISHARKIDDTLKVVWDHVEALDKDHERHGDRTDIAEDKRRREWIEQEVKKIGPTLSNLRTEVDQASNKLSKHLPWNSLKGLTQSVDACDFLLNPLEAQLKYLRGRIAPSSSLGLERGVEQGTKQAEEQGAEHGTEYAVVQSRHGAVTRMRRPTERQLWRLLDLHEGGTVGFTLELYLLSLTEILSEPTSAFPSNDFRDNFFSAFGAIASNRDLSKCTIWSQKLILALICDIAAKRGVFSDFSYPHFIEDELVHLLRSVAAGVRDVSNIGLAVEDLERVRSRHRHVGFREKVLGILRQNLPKPLALATAPTTAPVTAPGTSIST
jgi:Family of unknown function (DUF6535)